MDRPASPQPLSLSLSLLLGLGAGLGLFGLCGGCNAGRFIESGAYPCDHDDDCVWGFRCLPIGSQTRRCVHPAESPATHADGGLDRALPPDAAPAEASLPDAAPVEASSVDTATGVCQPGVGQCVDLVRLQRCNATGTGYLPVEPCPAFHRCNDGACEEAGRVEGRIALSVTVPPLLIEATLGVQVEFAYAFTEGDPPPPAPAVGECLVHQPAPSEQQGVIFDAGPITLTGVEDQSRLLTYDSLTRRYRVSPSLPTLVVGAEGWLPYGQVLTFSGEGNELVSSPFSVAVTVPPKRVVNLAEGATSYPAGAPLRLEWSGATGQGTVTLTVTSSSAPEQVRCTAADDGAFTVDAGQLAAYSAGTSINVELSDEDVASFVAAGLTAARATASLRHSRTYSVE